MCGITALISLSGTNIINDLYESLYHLQHRGQDSFGFSFLSEEKIKVIKEKCLLSTLSNLNTKNINTSFGIGHVRYPTKGENTLNEVQPFLLKGKRHTISIVHNGQIWKTEKLINYLKEKEIELNKNITSDSIILLYLLSYHLNKYESLTDKILKNIIYELYDLLEGSYNCICIIENYGIICFKDKNSIRPLILGKKMDNYIISSESISIDSLEYTIVDDIYNNELLIFDISNKEYRKSKINYESIFKPCIFEWIYLAREESIIYNVNVYETRYKMGEYLAKNIMENLDKEKIREIDYVIPIPDTSKPVALAVSKILNIPYYEAITKNRYVNRTFIMNTQETRKSNIKRKLNIVKQFIDNKNILIIDDSIVRGNTIEHIIKLLKKNNVKKLYVASSCPEIKYENKYGIDIPNRKELISYNKNSEEIEKKLRIDKLFFQKISDLKKSIQIFNNKLTTFEMSILDDL